MHRVLFGFLLILPNSAAAQTPGERYKTLVKEFTTAHEAYSKRLQAAATVAEQGKLFREANPQPAFALRFLELATKHPNDPIAFKSLTWVVENAEFGPAAEKPYAQAVALLASKYADHNDAESLFERMANSPFAAAGTYLRAVFDRHSRAAVRGRAGFHLALHFKNYCDTIEQLRLQPHALKNTEVFLGQDLLKRFLDADTAGLRRQAEAALERVRKDHAFVSYVRNNKRSTLGKAADAELFELRHLVVGKTPPDLEGEDTDGKKFKLSEYRGKVVVIVFWGFW